MNKTPLRPPAAPPDDSGYTPGILAEGKRLLVVSGQGPQDLRADLETQMRQTFERIALILHAGGASWEHVVVLRAFFTDFARALPVYRKVRREYLSKPFPASTAVGVSALAPEGNTIEIECTAIL